jgi:hypothetical protein
LSLTRFQAFAFKFNLYRYITVVLPRPICEQRVNAAQLAMYGVKEMCHDLYEADGGAGAGARAEGEGDVGAEGSEGGGGAEGSGGGGAPSTSSSADEPRVWGEVLPFVPSVLNQMLALYEATIADVTSGFFSGGCDCGELYCNMQSPGTYCYNFHDEEALDDIIVRFGVLVTDKLPPGPYRDMALKGTRPVGEAREGRGFIIRGRGQGRRGRGRGRDTEWYI